MICNSSLAKRSESSAPLQGPPSRSTRGGFGFFRWLDSGVGKATPMERNGWSSPFRRRREDPMSPSYISHEGVPARGRDCSLFLPFLGPLGSHEGVPARDRDCSLFLPFLGPLGF